MTMSRRPLAIGLLLATALLSGGAWADKPRRDPAAAEALFTAGREALSAGRVEEACKKFAESYALDEALGALLNLAACHEKLGKTASAWTEYKEAAALAARMEDKKRRKLAEERARALEPELAYLVIEVRGDSEGLRIRRAGVPLGEASYGAATPVDPGSVEVVAEAPGKSPFRRVLHVGPGERVEVTVPRLSPLGREAPPATPPDPEEPSARPQEPEPPRAATASGGKPTGAYVLVGLGAVSLVAGGVFVGLTAKEKGTLDEHCPDKRCDPEGLDASSRAQTYAWTANATVGAGAMLAGIGLIWLFTGNSSEEPSTSVGVAPTEGGAALFGRGSF